MDSSAISRRDKYCHNGGMAFAPGSASACLGVHDGDHGPFRRSPENSPFAGEKPQGLGSVPFGGSDGLVCLFLHGGRKYCHNGGRAFATTTASATEIADQWRARDCRGARGSPLPGYAHILGGGRRWLGDTDELVPEQPARRAALDPGPSRLIAVVCGDLVERGRLDRALP
jgi:hypothetical protein